MKRREFITFLGGAAVSAWPVGAWAQKQQIRQVVILPGANTPEGQTRVAALRRRLEGLGWFHEKNYRLVVHWWAPNPANMQQDLAGIISRKPDVIVTGTSVAIAQTLRTSSIPVVFASITDPVGQGFVNSLAKPGGNATGFSAYEASLGGKWVEILKEVSPNLIQAAAIYEPTTAPYMTEIVRSIMAAALAFGVDVRDTPIHTVAELEHAISLIGQKPHSGLIVPPAHFTLNNFELINALSIKHRLPAIHAVRSIVDAGGLISYGANSADQFEKAGDYVGKILRGAKPSDLPVQQPTKFELVINLKTARALGITVPPTLLARADEVIE